jgi:hypothetical protein
LPHCFIAHWEKGRKANNTELVNQEQDVPQHLELPKLSKLLKMRQNPADDDDDDPENNTQQAFTFLVEHLLGQVIGKRD